jgi:hypothetical protein
MPRRTAEERIQIIIDWVQKNPKELKGLVQSFNNIDKAYGQAHKTLMAGTSSTKEQTKLTGYLAEALADAYEHALRHRKGFQMIKKALEIQERDLDKSQKRWEGYGKSLSKAGRTMGFYGFIVSFSIQRILRSLQDVARFFTQSITYTSKWIDGIIDARLALAYMKAAGLEGTEAFENSQRVLDATVENLYANGMKVDALWRGLNAQWHSVQVTIATALIPTLTELLALIAKQVARPETQRALQELARAFGQVALAIVPIIPSLVAVAKTIADILVFLRPFYGIIIPVVAALFVMGTVLTIIGPLITSLGYAIKAVTMLKRWWGEQTIITQMRLKSLGTTIGSLIVSIGLLAGIMFMFTRQASASARELENDYDAMTGDIRGNIVKISDEHGNLIYTINTLTGEVENAAGELVGSWSSITGYITDDATGAILGYYDDTYNVFTGLSGEMEQYSSDTTTALDEVQEATDSMDFTSLQDSMGDLDSSFDSLGETMNWIAWVAIADIIVQIGLLIGKFALLRTASSTALAGAAAAAGGEVAGGIAGGAAGVGAGILGGAGLAGALGTIAGIALPIGIIAMTFWSIHEANIANEKKIEAMKEAINEMNTAVRAGQYTWEQLNSDLEESKNLLAYIGGPQAAAVRVQFGMAYRDAMEQGKSDAEIMNIAIQKFGNYVAIAAQELNRAGWDMERIRNALEAVGYTFAEGPADLARQWAETRSDIDKEWAWGGLVKAKEQLTQALQSGDAEDFDIAMTNLAYALMSFYDSSEEAKNQAAALASQFRLTADETRTLYSYIDYLSGLLAEMSFKHAGPMAEEFNRILANTIIDVSSTASAIDGLTDSLRGVASPGEIPLILESSVGAGEAAALPGGPVTQYITVHAIININGPISSNISLDMIRDAVDEGIGEAWRRRS